MTVRMRCGFSAKGTLQLKSAGSVKTGKGKARRLTLGRKSFTGKKNQLVNVKVKMSKSARKALKGKKRLKARGPPVGPPRRDQLGDAQQQDEADAESVWEMRI